MADYIERKAIKYELWAVVNPRGPLMVVRKETIDRIPAAEVAPVVHGRWKKINPYKTKYECSECGATWPDYQSDFCQDCGARMDGENE